MENLSSVKTQYSRIPLLYSSNCFFDSKRKTSEPSFNFWINFHHPVKGQRLVLHSSYNERELITQQGVQNFPLPVVLEPITGESQFDRVLAEAQQLEESVVVLWMASWCRKCIYLKPKLEKLAADYYPRIRFYSIDVNAVPHKLVVRAGVTKMPTIQLWRDSKKQSEVIGGHKAYLVINEIREIIEDENNM